MSRKPSRLNWKPKNDAETDWCQLPTDLEHLKVVEFFNGINGNFEDPKEKLLDTTEIVLRSSEDGQEVLVSRYLACSASPVLRSVFPDLPTRPKKGKARSSISRIARTGLKSWRQKKENSAYDCPFDIGTIHLVKEFITTAKTRISVKFGMDLLKAANYFSMENLYINIWSWLETKLDPGNALVIFHAARLYNEPSYLSKSWNLLSLYDFNALVLDNPLFYSLDLISMKMLLKKRNKLVLCCEEKLVESLFQFFHQKPTIDFKQLLYILLDEDSVNLNSISNGFWQSNSGNEAGNEMLGRFSKMMLELRRASLSIYSSKHIVSVGFSDGQILCPSCNGMAFLHYEVETNQGFVNLCDNCWRLEREFVIDLDSFTFQPVVFQPSLQVFKKRKSIRKSFAIRSKTRFSSLWKTHPTATRSDFESIAVSNLPHPQNSANETNGGIIYKPWKRNGSQRQYGWPEAFSLHNNNVAVGQNPVSVEDYGPFLPKSILPGRYVLMQTFGPIWETSLVDVYVAQSGYQLIGTGRDTFGNFVLEGFCVSNEFELFKVYPEFKISLNLKHSVSSSPTGQFSFFHGSWESNSLAIKGTNLRRMASGLALFQMLPSEADSTPLIGNHVLFYDKISKILSTSGRKLQISASTTEETLEFSLIAFGSSQPGCCPRNHNLLKYSSPKALLHALDLSADEASLSCCGCNRLCSPNVPSLDLKDGAPWTICPVCVKEPDGIQPFLFCPNCFVDDQRLAAESYPSCLKMHALQKAGNEKKAAELKLQKLGTVHCNVCSISLKDPKTMYYFCSTCEKAQGKSILYCSTCAISQKVIGSCRNTSGERAKVKNETVTGSLRRDELNHVVLILSSGNRTFTLSSSDLPRNQIIFTGASKNGARFMNLVSLVDAATTARSKNFPITDFLCFKEQDVAMVDESIVSMDSPSCHLCNETRHQLSVGNCVLILCDSIELGHGDLALKAENYLIQHFPEVAAFFKSRINEGDAIEIPFILELYSKDPNLSFRVLQAAMSSNSMDSTKEFILAGIEEFLSFLIDGINSRENIFMLCHTLAFSIYFQKQISLWDAFSEQLKEKILDHMVQWLFREDISEKNDIGMCHQKARALGSMVTFLGTRHWPTLHNFFAEKCHPKNLTNWPISFFQVDTWSVNWDLIFCLYTILPDYISSALDADKHLFDLLSSVLFQCGWISLSDKKDHFEELNLISSALQFTGNQVEHFKVSHDLLELCKELASSSSKMTLDVAKHSPAERVVQIYCGCSSILLSSLEDSHYFPQVLQSLNKTTDILISRLNEVSPEVKAMVLQVYFKLYDHFLFNGIRSDITEKVENNLIRLCGPGWVSDDMKSKVVQNVSSLLRSYLTQCLENDEKEISQLMKFADFFRRLVHQTDSYSDQLLNDCFSEDINGLLSETPGTIDERKELVLLLLFHIIVKPDLLCSSMEADIQLEIEDLIKKVEVSKKRDAYGRRLRTRVIFRGLDDAEPGSGPVLSASERETLYIKETFQKNHLALFKVKWLSLPLISYFTQLLQNKSPGYSYNNVARLNCFSMLLKNFTLEELGLLTGDHDISDVVKTSRKQFLKALDAETDIDTVEPLIKCNERWCIRLKRDVNSYREGYEILQPMYQRTCSQTVQSFTNRLIMLADNAIPNYSHVQAIHEAEVLFLNIESICKDTKILQDCIEILLESAFIPLVTKTISRQDTATSNKATFWEVFNMFCYMLIRIMFTFPSKSLHAAVTEDAVKYIMKLLNHLGKGDSEIMKTCTLDEKNDMHNLKETLLANGLQLLRLFASGNPSIVWVQKADLLPLLIKWLGETHPLQGSDSYISFSQLSSSILHSCISRLYTGLSSGSTIEISSAILIAFSSETRCEKNDASLLKLLATVCPSKRKAFLLDSNLFFSKAIVKLLRYLLSPRYKESLEKLTYSNEPEMLRRHEMNLYRSICGLLGTLAPVIKNSTSDDLLLFSLETANEISDYDEIVGLADDDQETGVQSQRTRYSSISSFAATVMTDDQGDESLQTACRKLVKTLKPLTDEAKQRGGSVALLEALKRTEERFPESQGAEEKAAFNSNPFAHLFGGNF